MRRIETQWSDEVSLFRILPHSSWQYPNVGVGTRIMISWLQFNATGNFDN